MSEHLIRTKKIILHILDSTVGAPVLSQKEISDYQEAVDFVTNITQKMLDNDNLKQAFFTDPDNNQIKALCEHFLANAIDFVHLSHSLASLLYAIMCENPTIPIADMICTIVTIDDLPYLGIYKLNYRSNYIHYVQYEADQNVNLLVKQHTVLPGENQKPEEAVLINLDDFSIRILEKEYELNGEKGYYLSRLYLGCEDQLSTAQKAQIIKKVTDKMLKKHRNDDYDSMMKMRKTVTENMDNSKAMVIDNLARELFYDDPGAQREYIEEVKLAGIQDNEVQLSEKIMERKFRTHKLKTDTGIEINFPATYYNNREMIEFINNPNGTISIVIKNIGKIINK